MTALAALTPTSALSAPEIAEIRRRIGEHPIFRLYFETALEALADGDDNRRFLISEAGGLIQAIDFDTLRVMTATAPLGEAEARLLTDNEGPTELHLDPALAEVVRGVAKNRITADLALGFYHLPSDVSVEADSRCQRLGRSDVAEVRDFARRHNPKTIFSDWMIELPFFGLRSAGELAAVAGVIANHAGLGACMLGTFVTAPEFRGRGYAKALCRGLVSAAREAGYVNITLCTTQDNIPARRAYEAVGFQCIETRRQIELAARDSPSR